MANTKPRIVIIGAGMAGLTAANKLYTSTISDQIFDLRVVEGGSRIGGRVNSSEFCGDRVELGATWIHGIEGSPLYRIAEEGGLLHSHQPWECMDGLPRQPVTVAEGGHVLDPSFCHPILRLFKNLVRSVEGKAIDDDASVSEILKLCDDGENPSVGSFLRKGLEAYWGRVKDERGVERVGKWSRRSLVEAFFAMCENTHRSYSAAEDLWRLDYKAEKEYKTFPGEEITIARGYTSVIESLASVLPAGMIQLGREVEKIEWLQNGSVKRPVKLHFSDGLTLSADHVIVTVSLGVLKRGIGEGCNMFHPALPCFKTGAISRLGFGLVDKVFLQESDDLKHPCLQMVFHPPDSELRHHEIPQWMRKTSRFYPIYTDSRIRLSWFVGKEALELESLSEEEIAAGFSATAANLLSSRLNNEINQTGNKLVDGRERGGGLKFGKVLRTQWGTNPLFLGSYSYVAVGSSGDDMDALSEPLPENGNRDYSPPPLQILFAGEATHRTYYGTTHAAYLSGLREANRLLQHYKSNGV